MKATCLGRGSEIEIKLELILKKKKKKKKKKGIGRFAHQARARTILCGGFLPTGTIP